MCTPRRSATTRQSDLITRRDLTNGDEWTAALDYIKVHKPIPLTMRSPCTVLIAGPALIDTSAPNTHNRTRKTSVVIADFAVDNALLQLAGGMHFILEKQACSEMGMQTGKVCPVNVPQCALGLVNLGEPVDEHTTSWAPRITLLEPFRGTKLRVTSTGHQKGATRPN